MNEKIAQEGYWLTQSNLIDEYDRIFNKKIAGFGNLNSMFEEWTDEQKTQWELTHTLEDEISDNDALNIIIGN